MLYSRNREDKRDSCVDLECWMKQLQDSEDDHDCDLNVDFKTRAIPPTSSWKYNIGENMKYNIG